MHMTDAGGTRHSPDDAAHLMTVERPAVVAGDEPLFIGMSLSPRVEEVDQYRVQRQVSIVAELAHRDLQPMAGAD
jgi:hypothetical protein